MLLKIRFFELASGVGSQTLPSLSPSSCRVTILSRIAFLQIIKWCYSLSMALFLLPFVCRFIPFRWLLFSHSTYKKRKGFAREIRVRVYPYARSWFCLFPGKPGQTCRSTYIYRLRARALGPIQCVFEWIGRAAAGASSSGVLILLPPRRVHS